MCAQFKGRRSGRKSRASPFLVRADATRQKVIEENFAMLGEAGPRCLDYIRRLNP